MSLSHRNQQYGSPDRIVSDKSFISTDGLFENASVISKDYTIGVGNNAQSAGPISINPGVVVTIPPGSVWIIH